MYKVYLSGRDFIRWATDDDYDNLKKILNPFCHFTSLQDCEFIHTVNWYSLLEIPLQNLKSKYIIAQIPHDISVMLQIPAFYKISPYVNQWIVMSKKADRLLSQFNLKRNYIPYSVDTRKFFLIENNDLRLGEIRQKFNIPRDKYLIGSFQRDTEGKDLITPKYKKGPDIFFEIIKGLYRKNKNICVVLAGPRRFWLIDQLLKQSIPFVYIGKQRDRPAQDDIDFNTQSNILINYLYNIIDTYLVSSRLEGGPKAIQECAAAKCKIISTDVGHAPDILSSDVIYNRPYDAIELLFKDITYNTLSNSIERNYRNVLSTHSLDNVRKSYENLYEDLAGKRTKLTPQHLEEREHMRNIFVRISHKIFRRKCLCVLKPELDSHKCGRNQFLFELQSAIKKNGFRVSHKRKKKGTVFLFNTISDPTKIRERLNSKKKSLYVHRIDWSALTFYEKDGRFTEDVFISNNEIADISVFQSFEVLLDTVKKGLKPVNPIIIPDFVSSSIFNKNNRTAFSTDRKIRLISPIEKPLSPAVKETLIWLDKNLDWKLYEFTLIGHLPDGLELNNISCSPWQTAQGLASLFKKSDIFFRCSDQTTCTDLIGEALACGLPVLYNKAGTHLSQVGYGGLQFKGKQDIKEKLSTIIKHYELFQNLIVTPDPHETIKKYLELFSLKNEKSIQRMPL